MNFWEALIGFLKKMTPAFLMAIFQNMRSQKKKAENRNAKLETDLKTEREIREYEKENNDSTDAEFVDQFIDDGK